MKEITPKPGQPIESLLEALVQQAPAFAVFNDTRVEAWPGVTVANLFDEWQRRRPSAGKEQEMEQTKVELSLDNLDVMVKAMGPRCAVCGQVATCKVTVEGEHEMRHFWYHCDDHDLLDWPATERDAYRAAVKGEFPPKKTAWEDLPQASLLRRLNPTLRRMRRARGG